MKTKLFLLSIGVIITIHLQAQDFAPVGAKWYFPETFWSNNNMDLIINQSIGDTVINNLSCRVIEKGKNSCTVPVDDQFLTHQRNDSILLYDEFRDSFDLIFDFGADVGESWSYYNSISLSFNSTITVMIDSISYFYYSQSDSLKVQHVTLMDSASPFPSVGEAFKIFENIGYEIALLPGQFAVPCDANYERPIRCYEDPIVGLIKFDTNLECDYITNSENRIKETDLEIFPNPTSDKLFFKTKELQLESVQVFSLEGELLKEIPIEKFEVDMSFFNTGLYFLKIKTNQGLVIEKVMVKRN